MSRSEQRQAGKESNTLQAEHLPSHVTSEFWQDLTSESEKFLSGLDPKVSQLWHVATHVASSKRSDPGCQTIAARDFRLFQRSEQVRRHVYEICQRATQKVEEQNKRGKGKAKPDEDIIAASYGAYSAHVVVDDMRTDEGDRFRTKMYRDFIFAIDKRYKVFRRLAANRKRIYWDVVLGCWAYANDAFCVPFFPCPWIQEDSLEWQPVFAKEAKIETRELYKGANGILTNSRICQLFARGVLVLIPSDVIDRHGCDQFKIRLMDPNYPHMDDPIFGHGKVPDIDTAEVEEPGNVKGKRRASSPPPTGLESLTFRQLDKRSLQFRRSAGFERPSIPLLWWQFVTAMVKITWQIPPNELDTKLRPLQERWREIWMSYHMNKYFTLGTSLAFSHLLNNPAGGIIKSGKSSSTEPFTFVNPDPDTYGNFTILDKVLTVGCPAAFNLDETSPAARQDNIHYSPILLLCNEILHTTPHPDDASPNTYTVAESKSSSTSKSKSHSSSSSSSSSKKSSAPPPAAEQQDINTGIVTQLHQRCQDCSHFELAVLTDVQRRGGNPNDVCFVHHHVAQPTNRHEEKLAGIGSTYDYNDMMGWDHTELKKANKERSAVYERCEPCQSWTRLVKEKRDKLKMSRGYFVYSHHVAVANRIGLASVDRELLSFEGLRLD
ncbi:hypothetical protein QBC37DRAFT_39803 [Rhypophila decipiens]|uniref:Uncharacterized protein n=1 Tax=Rhypophila decipiens TaxID=261697 RepID=A0AAN6YJ97_9PEZI|nr:hypothetical protein QBC37DRAFT_39803 [Rhypophila decipiens]